MYKRLVKKGRKPGSKESMATFFTSAVWVCLFLSKYLADASARSRTGILPRLHHWRNLRFPRPSISTPCPATRHVGSYQLCPIL